MEVIRPGWAWTTVPAIVREAASFNSTRLGWLLLGGSGGLSR